jgi:mRNA-degrading endonuclease RelE of RelBE toxin-antitoxin system
LKKTRARFTPEAARLIATLPPEIKKLVRASVDELLVNPESGSELTGELEGYRSSRAKRYRIVYRLDEPEMIVEILLVRHRRDVYDALRSLLTGGE